MVALPGAVLPGGFAISARKTYGHVSDGMICSVRELGIGDEHTGSWCCAPDAGKPGDDALDLLGLRERGARHRGHRRPRLLPVGARAGARGVGGIRRRRSTTSPQRSSLPPADGRGLRDHGRRPGRLRPVLALRAITGLDPAAPVPGWMRRRLRQSGMRPISLAVDVTNYVMLETGQPLHAFDRAKLTGPIGVRRADAGERLSDTGRRRARPRPRRPRRHRRHRPDRAGRRHGRRVAPRSARRPPTSCSRPRTWTPVAIARAVAPAQTAERGVASRFERGVDPQIAAVALQRCVDLLVEHGGATCRRRLHRRRRSVPRRSRSPWRHRRPAGRGRHADRRGDGRGAPAQPGRLHGRAARRTLSVICRRPGARTSSDPADLVEEVVRLEGYDKIPSELPHCAARARADRRAAPAANRVAGAGGSRAIPRCSVYPFVAPLDARRVRAWPPTTRGVRRLRLVNPLSEAEPELRTSLLPGLLATAAAQRRARARATSRCSRWAWCICPRRGRPAGPAAGASTRRPARRRAGRAVRGACPTSRGTRRVVLAGDIERPGWWGAGRAASWADAVRGGARGCRVRRGPTWRCVRRNTRPWHPGRCAELVLDGAVVGPRGRAASAGHRGARAAGAHGRDGARPRRVHAARAGTRSGDLARSRRYFSTSPWSSTPVSPPPICSRRCAYGGGELLESVRLFDVFADAERLGPGRKSVAFALRCGRPTAP